MEGLTDKKLSRMLENVGQNLTAYRAGNYILTDDKAPVELLGIRVIDNLIEDEVVYYKQIYEKDGVRGLLENF